VAKVIVVLNRPWAYGGMIRQPGHVLLEAVLPEGLTAVKLKNVIAFGAAEIREVVPTNVGAASPKEAESSLRSRSADFGGVGNDTQKPDSRGRRKRLPQHG
jgi:hypothetical protein